MTSPISSFSQSHGSSSAAGSSKAPSPVTAQDASLGTLPGTSADAAGQGEAVTLTPDARTSTELLEAARAAEGSDQDAVQSLKSQIASSTYQVPPEKLAAAIVAALAEIRS